MKKLKTEKIKKNKYQNKPIKETKKAKQKKNKNFSFKLKINKRQLVNNCILKNGKKIKSLIFIGTLTTIFIWLFWGIPLPTKLSSQQVPISTKLFDRNNKLIYEIYADKKSTPVALEDLPQYVKQATLAIEDKNFYKHHGVSLTGIIRAGYNTIFRRKLQGGSTLTQQLIKNSLLSPERTIRRKIREFVLTLIVETIYPKDKILELYLNQIPYGGTAYGIGAAAETYFGKNAKDLTLAEATLLAGLPAAPSYYSPFGAYPELTKGRQETVLKRMLEDGYINQEEFEKAKNEELKFVQTENLKAPHFALWVKKLLADEYGEAVVEKGGLRVYTTLDLELQEFAQNAVANEVAKLKNQKVGNGAALVTRPKTGEILAMVGSKDYFAEDEDGKVNIIFANRQPGSSIKPLNYALALKDGRITASTVLADIPTCFLVTGQKNYCPGNYDGSFHGGVQTRFALGNSYNIPAVRVLALNGLENFIDFAKKMGITTFKDPSNYGLSITLGGGEVKPADMAVAFGVFANQGIKQPLIPVLKIEDWKGKVLKEIKPEEIELTGDRVLESAVTFLISHILLDNNARSAAFGESSYLNVKGHPEVSVKTGTTNDRRDNWTIGYTSHILAVSWVGNNDYSEMSGAVSGVSGASPIWNKVIKEALDKAEKGFYNKKDKGHAWPEEPDGIVGKEVCVTTGIIPQPENFDANCQTRFEYFLKDYLPLKIKGGVQDVHFDKRTGLLIDENTPSDQIEIVQRSVIFDPLDTLICLDCPILPSSQSAKIKYPLIAD